MIKEVTLSEVVGSNGVFVDGDWVESKDQDPKGDVRLIQLADIGDGNFIDKSSRFLTSKRAIELNCTFLEPGDLLIARMPDPLGRACIFPGFDFPCVTVVDVCIVRPDKDQARTDWLKFMINSPTFRSTINKFVTGTTRQRISRGNLNKLKFKLPPLRDQVSIANILSKAESLISQRKESIHLLDEFLKSTFLEMFGDPVTNPKGWEVKNFGEIIESIRYGTSTPPEYMDQGIPFIRATNIKKGRINKKDLVYISEDEAAKIAKCKIKVGDLIIVRSGANTGDAATIPMEFNDAYAAYDLIITLNHVSSIFYNELINSEYGRTKIKPLTQRSGQPHLNSDQVKSLRFYFPPIARQSLFANVVAKTEAVKVHYRASLQELENLYGSLSQRAFKGDLNVKDAESLLAAEPSKPYGE